MLFVGINPGLRSAATGHNFAGRSNRFWPALHTSGFTPRQLAPEEDGLLPSFGLGIANLVARPTRAASELSREELVAGGAALAALVGHCAPRLVAMVGVTAYRVAFTRPRAGMGLQAETLGGRPVWVLPNPSGLNAHYTPAGLAAAFAEAREYACSLDFA